MIGVPIEKPDPEWVAEERRQTEVVLGFFIASRLSPEEELDYRAKLDREFPYPNWEDK